MRPQIRRVARTLLPDERYDEASFAARRLRKAVGPGSAEALLDRRFVAAHGLTVRRGPFAGLVFSPKIIGFTGVTPKLVGAYEHEIYPGLEAILSRDIATFVDIGSGDGFYAAGVARRRPDVRVIAYDLEPPARAMTRLLGRLNGVALDVRGEARVEHLVDLGERTAILCDAEGAETALLDPARAPVLARLPIIVEIHAFVDPAIGATLRERFGGSHAIEERAHAWRDPRDYPELSTVFHPDEAALALSELRPDGMTWLVMTPLAA